MKTLTLGLSLAFFTAGCQGSTGSDLFTFKAFAAGPEGAQRGAPLAFQNGLGFDVSLTQATLHVGAVYMNRAVPVSGSQETNCVLPSLYVAQVTTGRDLDLLDGAPQPFDGDGEATADRALAGEVWLTHGDIAADDPEPVLTVEGTAKRGDASVAFHGAITTGQNKLPAVTDPAQPGAHPLCKARIVSPVRINLVPTAGGSLLLRIDPAAFFDNVDFAALPPSGAFDDAMSDQPSLNLYRGLITRDGPYSFFWQSGGAQ